MTESGLESSNSTIGERNLMNRPYEEWDLRNNWSRGSFDRILPGFRASRWLIKLIGFTGLAIFPIHEMWPQTAKYIYGKMAVKITTR